MKKIYIVDEERMFSNLIVSAAEVAGLEPVPFYDASSAYQYFHENSVLKATDYFWVDMYLLPGENSKFAIGGENFDQYKVGLNLANLLVQESIISPDHRENLTLYTGHITKFLWTEIEKFCSEHGATSFRKQAGTTFGKLVDLMPG